MDQHAADERILLEELQAKVGACLQGISNPSIIAFLRLYAPKALQMSQRNGLMFQKGGGGGGDGECSVMAMTVLSSVSVLAGIPRSSRRPQQRQRRSFTMLLCAAPEAPSDGALSWGAPDARAVPVQGD